MSENKFTVDMVEAQILRNFDAQKMEVVEIEKRIIVQSNIDNKNEVRK